MKRITKSKQISLFFFIFSIGCVATFVILDLLFYTYNIKERLKTNTIQIANQKEQEFLSSVQSTSNLLFSIRNSKHFNEYILYPKIFESDIADIFLTLAQNDKSIMQLRYLDKNGIERIRIDRDIDKPPFIVKENKLQNKFSRYYFKDSINKDEKVWFSNLDLNIEHGKVEIPYKPTLRAILPIKLHSEFNGILIVNYYMKNILTKIVNIPSHEMIIMNEKGFPLIHYNNQKNWGFYKKNKINLQSEFPNKYNQIIHTTDILEIDELIVKKIALDLPEKYNATKSQDNYFVI